VSLGADLVVSALQVRSTAAAGAVLSVGDTTKNQGAGVAGSSTTRFYLSTNLSLDAADILLDGSRPVPSLRAGRRAPGLLRSRSLRA